MRRQAGTLGALQDVERGLPFPLLVLDSASGEGFLSLPVLGWLQRRERPVFMTRNQAYTTDDNAQLGHKN